MWHEKVDVNPQRIQRCEQKCRKSWKEEHVFPGKCSGKIL